MEEWLSYRLGDFLMFSGRTYWRLFEIENAALWPLPALAPAAGGVALAAALRRPAPGLQALAALLAIAWAWAGWSFVWQRYAPINWGVAYAAPLFGVQALLLARAALRPGGWSTRRGATAEAALARGADARVGKAFTFGASSWIGFGLLVWGVLLHPFSAPLFGRSLAGAEVVGMAPDPTAIATLGLALLLPSLRLAAAVIPALWLGFSALTLHLLEAPERFVPMAALLLAAAAPFAGRRGA